MTPPDLQLRIALALCNAEVRWVDDLGTPAVEVGLDKSGK